MKISAFILIILFLSTGIFSQEKRYYNEESRERIKQYFNYYPHKDERVDSLLINDKVYYFNGSPLFFLEGALNVVYDDILVIPQIDTGYTLLWSIEDGKLFIKSIYICRTDYTTDIKPTEDEALKKLEVFLGRNFEGDRLFADFATGKFVVYKYALSLCACGEGWSKYSIDEQNQYKKDILNRQRIYTLEFKNGILVKMSRNKKFERELKRFLKNIDGLPHPFI
ncbi:hypothetical protein [Proteiniphilum sp.]|uniref:hypothetical protein n=1 Tax=Proteiniphilum sp. TaxID=1926877 RepID=UPI002B1F46C2|nr:hypothetical protein [Proteiniphilum sp.]MEA4915991.1 hypothetical protein [Proteiniphilum sp.]